MDLDIDRSTVWERVSVGPQNKLGSGLDAIGCEIMFGVFALDKHNYFGDLYFM